MRAPSTSADALVGRLVADRYRIVQLLGSGGIGHVYLAEGFGDLAGSPSRVALKVLRAEHREKPDLVARFEREAIAAARIDHPNVLAVHGAPIMQGGVVCFAMELLVGLDLADTLAYARSLEPLRAIRIARGVAEGLSAAHAAGVIHRDVKPENIFLVHAPDGRERVKLLDFGFSFLRGDPDGPSCEVFGTPEYLAPEQAGGAPADVRADVYSLGIVLYELLAGRVPFSGDYPAIAHRHASEPPPPLGGPPILRELEAIVRKAIAKDPDQRFASMDEFGRALAALSMS